MNILNMFFKKKTCALKPENFEKKYNELRNINKDRELEIIDLENTIRDLKDKNKELSGIITDCTLMISGINDLINHKKQGA